MSGGDQGRTLRQILWEAERAAFIGRASEVAEFAAALRAVQGASSRHIWLQGIVGVGKSALLRIMVHQARSISLPVLHVEGAARPERVCAALGEFARELRHSLGMPVLATAPALAAGIQRVGWPRRSSLLVAVDDADRLSESEAHDLAALLRLLPVGVFAVWAARRLRPRLWAQALPTAVAAQRRTLQGLAPLDAQTLVLRDGVRLDAAVVHAASAGNPRLLNRVASLFEEPDTPAAPRDREAAAVSLLVEQWLNPGSRQLAWRAGVGQAGTLDTLLAAATVLGRFDRHALSELLGAVQVTRLWPQFERLPFVVRHPAGDRLDASLAGHLDREVRRHRPWAVRHWQLRVVRTVGGADPAVAWRESLVRAARWWPLLPDGKPEEGLAAAADVGGGDASVAAPVAAEGRPPLLVAVTDAGVVVRPAGRACLSCTRRVALPAAARSALEAHALVGSGLRAYGPRGGGAWQFCLSEREPEDSGGLPCGLVGRSAADLAGVRRLVVAAPSASAAPFDRLGFRSLGSGGAADLYDLDLTAVGLPWRLGLPDRLAPAPPPEVQAAAVQAALTAFDDPVRLLETPVAQYGAEAFRLGGAAQVRTWLEDMLALAAADGSLPPVDAKLLLASLRGPRADGVPAAVRLYRSRKAAARFAAVLFA